MKKAFTYLAAAATFSAALYAQEPVKGCITDQVMNEYLSKNPEAKARMEAQEAAYEKQDKEAFKTGYKIQPSAEKVNTPNGTQATVYYIPMVFHILHTGGPENITDAQVNDAVRIINRDWRKLNPDTTNTISQFKGIASDISIEFRLATIDPNGNCTNGIVRHYDPNTVWTSGNLSYYSYSGTGAGLWSPTKYLNVYVVKSINGTAAGYTYLPGTFSAGDPRDVIVILSTYVGSIGTGQAYTSRALTHEAGHWLNLQHPWGNTNSPGVACGNDGVSDTPITKGSNLVCNLSLSQCTAGVIENVQNYMDYSYCSTMFTAGQSARMRTAVASATAGRSNVITTTNQQATGILTYSQVCVPIANFHASSTLACAGTIITFNDSSSNAHPTAWHWSFPGGTMQGGTTVTDSMPKVSYATPGTYAVSYTATSSAGSNSITTTPSHTSFSEGFETTSLPGSDWNISSPGTNWTITSTAAATGTKSAMINNFSNTAGNYSIFESNVFDISGMGMPTLTFKMTYKQQVSTNADKLQVFTSTDCGNTWQSRFARTGSALANVTPPSTTPYVPSPSQFTTYTVNINGVSGSNNLRLRWEFFADATSPGNNIYIDDINLYDAAAGVMNLESRVGLNIYPNPSSGHVNIDFSMGEKHSIAVTVTDVLGRTIESISAKQYNAGDVKLNIAEKAAYQPGVYIVNIHVDGELVTRKIVIE